MHTYVNYQHIIFVNNPNPLEEIVNIRYSSSLASFNINGIITMPMKDQANNMGIANWISFNNPNIYTTFYC